MTGIALAILTFALFIALRPSSPATVAPDRSKLNRHADTLVIGDSGAVLWLDHYDGALIGHGGCHLSVVTELVENTRYRSADTVYVVGGLASINNGMTIADARAAMVNLSARAIEVFSPKTLICYDPAEMLRLLENPAYQVDHLHLNALGYARLRETGPLFFFNVESAEALEQSSQS